MDSPTIPVAVVSANRLKASETFIHNHVRRLPAQVHYLTGDWLPCRFSKGLEGADSEFVPGEVAQLGDAAWESQRKGRASAIAKYLKQHQIRAVLAEYGLAGVEIMDICHDLKIPLTVFFHAFDAFREDILVGYAERYGHLFGLAHALIGSSRQVCEQLEKLGAPPHKIHCNPCGYDEDLFQPRDAGTAPPTLLSVGRFTDKKAPHISILAFAHAHRAHPDAHLCMAGSGELHTTCRTLAKVLRLDDAVTFLGEVRQQEVADLMGRSRAFIQHSVTTAEGDREGTPVAIIEASAAGLPVVSTLHAGIPDVVVDGATGFLVEEGDFVGMAEAMTRLLRSPELASRMGAAASDRARSVFGITAHIQKLWRAMGVS